MDATSTIELLIKERDYHTSHPHEVMVKFIYGLATSLASIVVGIYFSGIKKEDLRALLANPAMPFISILFFAGLIVVCIGLAEHSNLHKQQRIRIESAIAYTLNNCNHFKFEEFWHLYSKHNLKYFDKKPLKKPTDLFALEPDTRSYWAFHDRKIEAGVILIFIAYMFVIIKAI